MEEIDAAEGGLVCQVMRNISRMECPVIAQRQQAIMSLVEVLKKENEIDIQSRPLHAAHRHGKAANESVANAGASKFSGNFWNGGFEIHFGLESLCFAA